MRRHTNILILLLLTGLCISAGAQNNPYKIDDSLYPIFQRAIKWRTQPQGLLIADTLYAEATQKKDKKAQCLALTIPVSFYLSTNNYEKLEQAATRAKEEARKNNYLQYYYSACTNEINCLLNNGHSLRALQKAEEMKIQAFKDQHEYGIFSCIFTLGNIYYMRQNREVATEYYKNALEYMLKNLPDQDPTYMYINLSEYYRDKGEGEVALEYAEKAAKAAKTNESRVASLLNKCEVLYSMKRINDFNACYDECTQVIEQYGVIRKTAVQRLHIYKLILNKNYDQAHTEADSLRNLLSANQMHHEIYLKSGNYEKAYIYNNWLHNYQDSVNRQVQSSDIAELNARIGTERIKLDAKALEYQNTALNLKNTQLELDRTKSQSELEMMNIENSKLVLENRNLDLARLNVEAEKQKAILKEQQSASQHYIVTLSLVLSFLFLFTCFLIFYLYRRRKTMAILQEKNEELTVARDHAEESDRMKSFFIQNMSHEIRTPLNAIVGFSQVLSTPDMEVDDEEKEEFSMLIQQNSELLTTLINDVLDLASLESGKYRMHLAPHRCNELCQVAMVSVVHRNPKKVKSYFTSDVPNDYLFVTDKERLQQVLINFLTNAEKHTERGEIHLHCSLTENPGKITFSVADTGPGIPADQADCVFDRFSKLDEFKQGTGLGLNICSIIAGRLKGEVKLNKNYTGGARFLFILPLDSVPDK